MLWDDVRENYGFRYLLKDRLNQDCLENLFSIIRGKGGHRFNPSPQEFRTALRQTMVDAVLVQSKSQNCRGDIDALLFSLDQVPSLGANTAVDS
ncbi:transposable element p transposase [Plakobranchus ocellatus]|uniref:Transposable element p transposase n=1 Tax=Plakobranchus ocellatus TaxID=259542 RepID=A0AAV4BYB0_9GAST|nr:transposable element p transposase [Plakobranchus ocellatus]